MACKKNHGEVDSIVSRLPIDQGRIGRHKCASCAYDIGFRHGLNREEDIDLAKIFNSIDESQKGARRHRSPHAAYALGYLDGVTESYE